MHPENCPKNKNATEKWRSLHLRDGLKDGPVLLSNSQARSCRNFRAHFLVHPCIRKCGAPVHAPTYQPMRISRKHDMMQWLPSVLLCSGLACSPLPRSVFTRLWNPGYELGEICVYKLIASHLCRPMWRNYHAKFTQQITRIPKLTNHSNYGIVQLLP